MTWAFFLVVGRHPPSERLRLPTGESGIPEEAIKGWRLREDTSSQQSPSHTHTIGGSERTQEASNHHLSLSHRHTHTIGGSERTQVASNHHLQNTNTRARDKPCQAVSLSPKVDMTSVQETPSNPEPAMAVSWGKGSQPKGLCRPHQSPP